MKAAAQKKVEDKTQSAALTSKTAVGVLKIVKLEEIQPSKTNPRKNFDPTKLEELAASIRSRGLQQPPLVVELPTYRLEEPDMIDKAYRVVSSDPNEPAKRFEHDPKDKENKVARVGAEGWFNIKKKQKPFEIVAGERRFRAAKLAGLTEIEVKVVKMTPQEILDFQLIENQQRENLDAIETAIGYQRILDAERAQGLSVEQLASRVGISRSAMYEYLALLELSKVAKEAYLNGSIDVSIAKLICRIPGEENQKAALEKILVGGERYHDGSKWIDDVMSFRVARTFIELEFLVKLKDAPWDLKDAALLPGAGSCATCLKRTGNCAEKFPDVKDKMLCLDRACFAMKKETYQGKLMEAAKARGQKIIKAKEWEKVRYGGQYHPADRTCYESGDGYNKSWGSLAKKLDVQAVIVEEDGEVKEVYPHDKLIAAMRDEGMLKRGSNGGGGGDDAYRKEARERKAKRDILKKIMPAMFVKIGEKALEDAADIKLWKCLAEMAWNNLGYMTAGEFLIAAGYVKKEDEGKFEDNDVFAKILKGFSKVAEVQAFTMRALAFDGWLEQYNADFGDNFKTAVEWAGVKIDSEIRTAELARDEAKKLKSKRPENKAAGGGVKQ